MTDNSKDETMAHTLRVLKLSVEFGEFLGLAKKDLHSLTLGALYHDRGKMFVPRRILYKKGRLTDEEYNIVKKHVENHGTKWRNKDIEAVILQHHEREDGSGYPKGLKSHQIHKLAKIIAIVDVYDALTAERAYRGAMSVDAAIGEMIKMPFNQMLFNHFLHFLESHGVYKNYPLRVS